MLEVSKMKMTPALSAEHQRKWDESRWECKLDDPERNYDKSRAHLNFEVRKGGVIAPVDQSVCIKEKVGERIAKWKAERLAATGKEPIVRSTQHLSVSLVIGGNSERMNELAFGNQVLQERGNNAHIKRMPEMSSSLSTITKLSQNVSVRLQLATRCENGMIGMLLSMRSGDWNVSMTSMKQAHVTSRSKNTTVNFIVRTNLSKRNLKPSVVL